MNVKKFLKAGKNLLVIRVITGEQNVDPEELSRIEHGVITEGGEGRKPDRGDVRRAFVRKPVYTYGFDWAPKVITVGIVGPNAYIDFLSKVKLEDINVFTTNINNDKAVIAVETVVDGINDISTCEGELQLDISYENKIIYSEKRNMLIRSGYNYERFNIDIDHAELWWPNGMGEQPLYEVKASITADGIFQKRKKIWYSYDRDLFRKTG